MIVIIGGGPTGLGAAYELNKRGHTDWLLLESGKKFGGLASSITDAGYTWDHGGHVVFSHYGEFDRMLEELFDDDELTAHDRSSYVWSCGTWIPYPFQGNIHLLPEPTRTQVIEDALRAPGWDGVGSFEDYFRAEMGDGLSDLFMKPYNKKVWTVDPSEMGTQWLGERVQPFDKKALWDRIHDGAPDIRWGPNNRFLFPKNGGTGEIWNRLGNSLPQENVMTSSEVVKIDAKNKIVYYRDWSAHWDRATERAVHYDTLISTMPLDELQRKTFGEAPSEDLVANMTIIVGVGLNKPTNDERSWLYFPEDTQPFYRATNFSHYADSNAPEGHGSWMCEIGKNNDFEMVDKYEVVDGLVQAGLIDYADVDVIHHHTIWKSYPVPVLGRDAAINALQPRLEELGIYSRGRFGAWKYEYGNMDHSVAWGLDIVRFILDGQPERQKAHD